MRKLPTITRQLVLEVAGDIVEETRNMEERGQLKKEKPSDGESTLEQDVIQDGKFRWSVSAVARLNRVPEGFMRDGTKERIQNCATKENADLITLKIAEMGIAESLDVMAETMKRDSQNSGE